MVFSFIQATMTTIPHPPENCLNSFRCFMSDFGLHRLRHVFIDFSIVDAERSNSSNHQPFRGKGNRTDSCVCKYASQHSSHREDAKDVSLMIEVFVLFRSSTVLFHLSSMPATEITIRDYVSKDGILINQAQLQCFSSTRPYCHYCQIFPYSDDCIVAMSDCKGVCDKPLKYISIFTLTFTLTTPTTSTNYG